MTKYYNNKDAGYNEDCDHGDNIMRTGITITLIVMIKSSMLMSRIILIGDIGPVKYMKDDSTKPQGQESRSHYRCFRRPSFPLSLW